MIEELWGAVLLSELLDGLDALGNWRQQLLQLSCCGCFAGSSKLQELSLVPAKIFFTVKPKPKQLLQLKKFPRFEWNNFFGILNLLESLPDKVGVSCYVRSNFGRRRQVGGERPLVDLIKCSERRAHGCNDSACESIHTILFSKRHASHTNKVHAKDHALAQHVNFCGQHFL